MIERFRYHASVMGVSGRITHPFDEVLPAQASLALPQDGGFGRISVNRFCFQGILSFEAAHALVSGSFSERDRTFDTTAMVTIEGLNILNMVTADRVVARIASSHHENPDRGHFITPLGSYIENLRIAGYPVTLDLATDTFHRLHNAGMVREAYARNTDGFGDEFDTLPRLGKSGVAEPGGVTACSLVRTIEGLPEELQPRGNVIQIRGLGGIRLAEFIMTDSERSITMISVDLGSTPTGSGAVGGASGNGSGY